MLGYSITVQIMVAFSCFFYFFKNGGRLWFSSYLNNSSVFFLECRISPLKSISEFHNPKSFINKNYCHKKIIVAGSIFEFGPFALKYAYTYSVYLTRFLACLMSIYNKFLGKTNKIRKTNYPATFPSKCYLYVEV